MHIGHHGGAAAIGVDHHQLGAALFPRPADMGHDIDLGGDGVAAPHHDQVSLGHFARIGAANAAQRGHGGRFHDRGADGVLLPGIAHGVAQPVDAIALQQTHGAGEVIGPDRFAAMLGGGIGEGAGQAVQRLIPGDGAELARTARPVAQQRLGQAFRVMHPLGVARDFGADDAGGVAVIGGATHPADLAGGEQLHLQGAGAGAIMRADGGCKGHSPS